MPAGFRAIPLLLAAAVAACADPAAPPSACPADGYPAGLARPASCTPGPGWLAWAFAREGNPSPAIFIGKPDGTCTQRVTADAAFYGAPAFVPGGRRLVYASTRSGLNSLYLLDLTTGAETRLDTAYAFSPPPAAPAVLTAATPAVSPDGTTVAFEGGLTAYPGWTDVFTVPVAGGDVVRVTRDPVAASLPRWSPDGSSLYYLSFRTGAPELRTVRPDGSGEAAVTSGAGISSRFDVTGDGQALVYARRAPSGAGATPTELVTLDLASGGVRVISSANEADPAVDAGTTTVAVSRRTDAGGYDLYLLDYASGAVRRQLTSCPGQAFGAAFAR